MPSMRADLAWAGAQRRRTCFSARGADGGEQSLSSPDLFRRRFVNQKSGPTRAYAASDAAAAHSKLPGASCRGICRHGMIRPQGALSNVVCGSRFIGAQSTRTHDAEHPFACNGGNRWSRESVFDNGIWADVRAFRQLPVISLEYASVETAARNAVEDAFSTLKHAKAMA